jgi:hypothetical protein
MAGRKVAGGKRIETWKRDVDGREIGVDVYMAKVRSSYSSLDGGVTLDEDANGGYPTGTRVFHALCAEADVHLVSRDIARLETVAWERVKANIAVEWKPVLLVTVNGDRPFIRTRRMRADYDPTTQLFPSDDSPSTDVKLSVEVEAYQLATINGVKHHRRTPAPARPGYRTETTRVHAGWPLVGDFTVPGNDGLYDSVDGPSRRSHSPTTVSMVDDTPENRAALLAVRHALERVAKMLDGLLHPENVRATLLRALSGTANVLALPSERKGTSVDFSDYAPPEEDT